MPELSRPGLRLESLEARETPAAVGALDPSFGTGGKVTADLGFDDHATALALAPDGKVVAVGYDTTATFNNFQVARFNPDGSFDVTFNGNGRKAVTFNAAEVATAVAVQPDGKIVVAGYTNLNGTAGNPQNFAVARLNADGSMDTSFDTDGLLTIDFGADDRASGVAVQPDGKIVIAGTVAGASPDFAVVRLNANGSFDTSFGPGTGKVTGATTTFGATDIATSLLLQPDGKIVVAGYTNNSGNNDFAVLRMNTDGTPDTSFDADGKQTVDLGGDDRVNAIALAPDGAIVLAGQTTAGGSTNVAVARLTPAGAPDPSFSGDGKFVWPLLPVVPGTTTTATGVAVLPTGQIALAAASALPGDLIVGFLNADGSPSTTPADGRVTIDFGGAETAAGIVVTPEGRIIVDGTTGATGAGNFALARLNATTGSGRALAAGGPANGSAVVYAPTYDPTGAGTYPATPTRTVSPFGTSTAQLRVAVGDANGDGVEDYIAVTGPGTATRLAVVDGRDGTTLLVPPTDPFGDANFTGGAFVSAGDIDNDGRAEIVVSPDQGGGPRVVVFSLLGSTLTVRANFFGIDDPAFRGGARTAVGDVNGDGFADLAVAAGFLGGPRVALFDGKSLATLPTGTATKLVNDFYAFTGSDVDTLRNGVFVAAGDMNGDGFADLAFGGGPGGGPRVLVLDGQQVQGNNVAAAQANPLANFFVAGNQSDRGGVRVAFKDMDGDSRADLAVGSGEGLPSKVRVYRGASITPGGEPASPVDLDPFGQTLAGGVFVG